MRQLNEMEFEICDAKDVPLSQNKIDLFMEELEGWEILEDIHLKKLYCMFPMKNYTQALWFTNAMANLADSVNHHPRIILEFNNVRVEWWTHTIKGLHKNDFIMAAKTNRLFSSIGEN